jgi:hypothetical protein
MGAREWVTVKEDEREINRISLSGIDREMG